MRIWRIIVAPPDDVDGRRSVLALVYLSAVFVAYVGQAASVDSIRRACVTHAAWLERPLELLGDSGAERSVLVGWDPSSADDSYRYVAVCRRAGECSYVDRLGDASARVRLHVHLDTPELWADVPLGAPVQLYHATAADGLLLTDDLRLVRRIVDPSLDRRGVYGLLKFGAVPAPHSLFEGVRRVRPGHHLRVSTDGRPTELDTWRETARGLAAATAAASLDEARTALVGAVDRALATLPGPVAVMYSGGVESTLIAARLAALGRSDSRLAHVELAELPHETVAAQRLADALGLAMETIRYEPGHTASVLAAAGRTWPFPFSDSSAVPTDLAARFAASLGPAVVAEGSAGQLMASRKLSDWSRRGSLLPPPLRRLVATGIRTSGLWRLGGRWEKTARAVGRNAGLPPAAAYLVKNALDGTTYSVPAEVLVELGAAIVEPLDGLASAPDAVEAFTIASLVLRIAGRYAPKTLGPLEDLGLSAVHPFLAPASVEASLRGRGPWSVKGHKEILRAQLELQLPAELVNRPKSAFSPPIGQIVAQPELHAAVETAISGGSPLSPYLRPGPIRQLLAEARRGEGSRLASGRPGRWLWTVAFTQAWLDGTDFARTTG